VLPGEIEGAAEERGKALGLLCGGAAHPGWRFDVFKHLARLEPGTSPQSAAKIGTTRAGTFPH